METKAQHFEDSIFLGVSCRFALAVVIFHLSEDTGVKLSITYMLLTFLCSLLTICTSAYAESHTITVLSTPCLLRVLNPLFKFAVSVSKRRWSQLVKTGLWGIVAGAWNLK